MTFRDTALPHMSPGNRRHLSTPTVSHHLKVLSEAGLVTRERRGCGTEAHSAFVPVIKRGTPRWVRVHDTGAHVHPRVTRYTGSLRSCRWSRVEDPTGGSQVPPIRMRKPIPPREGRLSAANWHGQRGERGTGSRLNAVGWHSRVMNELPSGFVLELKCGLDAPPEQIFRMLTQPVELATWWGPHGFNTPEIELDLSVAAVIVSPCHRGVLVSR